MRYFFIQYWVATGNMELKHCSTINMMANQFNKPLHGEILNNFRVELMKILEENNKYEMVWDGTKVEKVV